MLQDETGLVEGGLVAALSIEKVKVSLRVALVEGKGFVKLKM